MFQIVDANLSGFSPQVSDILLWKKPLSGNGVALGVVSTRVDGYPYRYDIPLSDFLDGYSSYFVEVNALN